MSSIDSSPVVVFARCSMFPHCRTNATIGAGELPSEKCCRDGAIVITVPRFSVDLLYTYFPRIRSRCHGSTVLDQLFPFPIFALSSGLSPVGEFWKMAR